MARIKVCLQMDSPQRPLPAHDRRRWHARRSQLPTPARPPCRGSAVAPASSKEAERGVRVPSPRPGLCPSLPPSPASSAGGRARDFGEP